MNSSIDDEGRAGNDVASRELPRSVLDNLIEGCQVIGPDYRYLYVNDAVVRQGKATREALLGGTMMECYPGIENTDMFAMLRECMEQRSPATMENRFTFPDGSEGCFELRFEPVPEGVAILSVDVTERKRDEVALRRAIRALTTLSRCKQSLVHATDEQLFLQEVCALLVELGGYRAARITLRGVDEEGQVRLLEQANAGDCRPEQEGAGDAFSLEIRSRESVLGTLEIHADEPDSFDVDERALFEEIAVDLGYGIETLRARVAHARTEEQLVAAQRLEAVGRLAGGVAHDFNNMLCVILAYAELAMKQLHKEDPVYHDIEQMREAGQRAATLTRQLLAFSRKQILEPRVTNINTVIGGIEKMLRRLIGEDIDIQVHPERDLGNVMADPGQLEQVIMNLAINARDAMPEGGKLTIETNNVELDENYATGHLSVEPGQYIRLSVADTGMGMSPETRSHIFEPFFTTKEVGKGTGLGLSMVYGIVKQSGGNIWVYSEPGQGTTFKIHLPRVDAAVASRKPLRPTSPATKNELILLVEDESSVRMAAERILQSAGYRVIVAGSSREALLECQRHAGQIELLVTDVVMPELGGRELAERLRQSNPELKVLFTSGYTDAAIVRHGVLDAGTHFLGKPFTVADLTRKVREVLDK